MERNEEGNNYPRLTSRLLELSAADDYEDAKMEWRITGRVWRDTAYGATHELVVNHPSGHAGACLCGHPIVYHFEIENTVTNVVEIVGSTCINNWMVLRHMSEVFSILSLPITEEKIEEWKKMTVEGLIRNAFWESDEGEDFKETFEEVKDLDLRINVRLTGKTYFDEKIAETRPVTKIRKSASGKFGAPDYQMASIVWRWNHPDNSRNQQTTRGYPNDRLCNDLALFDALIDTHLPKIEKEDAYAVERHTFLQQLTNDNIVKLREEFAETRENVKFMKSCNYYGFPIWKSTDGNGMWEKSFLSDMRRRFIRGIDPTEKQCTKLISILYAEKTEATVRQLRYLRDLGYEGDTQTLTKSRASALIDELKQRRR